MPNEVRQSPMVRLKRQTRCSSRQWCFAGDSKAASVSAIVFLYVRLLTTTSLADARSRSLVPVSPDFAVLIVRKVRQRPEQSLSVEKTLRPLAFGQILYGLLPRMRFQPHRTSVVGQFAQKME